MSNDELVAAIAYASQRLREVAPGEKQAWEFDFHLRELLVEQRVRARRPSTEAAR